MILKFGNETEISSFIISSHSSHISPSNIESTLQSKKFARKYHSKTLQRSIEYSIVLSAAEPTTLPFLGSKEVPFDILCPRATPLILKRAKQLIQWPILWPSVIRSLVNSQMSLISIISPDTSPIIHIRKIEDLVTMENVVRRSFFYANSKSCTDKKA